MSECKHFRAITNAAIMRFEDGRHGLIFVAFCHDCGTRFRFADGVLPYGELDPSGPHKMMLSLDGEELRAILEPVETLHVKGQPVRTDDPALRRRQ